MARNEKPQPPNGSDMELAEAFELVLQMAEASEANMLPSDRNPQAINLIRALAVGSYNMKGTRK